MEVNPVKADGVLGQAATPDKGDTKLKKACQEFEALLISQMLTKMRESVQKTDLFGSSKEEDLFQGMMDQEIAKQISTTKSMGLADMLYKQLSKYEKNY